MKLAIALALVLATSSVARADDASATAAAQAWLDAALTGGTLAPPSKKAPLDHVFTADEKKCAKVFTGRATSAKQLKKVVACIVAAHDSIFYDGEEAKPATWELDDLEHVASQFWNKKQIKKVKASGKGNTIVRAVFEGSRIWTYVWLAVAPDNTIKAVYLQQVSMD